MSQPENIFVRAYEFRIEIGDKEMQDLKRVYKKNWGLNVNGVVP